MFIRMYRSGKLICTIPVDRVRMTPENRARYLGNPEFGAFVSVRSRYIESRYSHIGNKVHEDLNKGGLGLAWVDRYGRWRLTPLFQDLMGSRTGVTFDRIVVE